MANKLISIGLLPAMMVLATAAHADETATDPVLESHDYYSGLEDLPLRRSITGIGHYSFAPPPPAARADGDIAADDAYAGIEGGSAGGYVSFGSPPTSSFLDSMAAEKDDSWFDGLQFGIDLRPDVNGAESHDFRQPRRYFSGNGIDRVGVRADLTAARRDEATIDGPASTWRLTGMLGSTSLSLLSGPDGLGLNTGQDGGGLLWDVGVGWSRGAMSVNAGYLSAYSFYDGGEERSAIAVLSLGADYALLPGLSVFGELNVTGGPPDRLEEGRGAAVIVGTGVVF